MANGDRTGTRTLRPRGSGTTTSVGDIASSVGRFFKEGFGTTPVRAPKVDFKYEDDDEEEKFGDPKPGLTHSAETIRARGPEKTGPKGSMMSRFAAEEGRKPLIPKDEDRDLSPGPQENPLWRETQDKIADEEWDKAMTKASRPEAMTPVSEAPYSVRRGLGLVDAPEPKKEVDPLTVTGSPEQLAGRRQLFKTVMDRARQGKLTFEDYQGIQGKDASVVGVTPKQFDDAFFKAGLRVKDGEFERTANKEEAPLMEVKPPEGDPRLAGMDPGGLREKDFANEDSYLAAVKERQTQKPLGSGSPLRQTPRELGTFSGAMNRAARRLKRKGAWGEAQKMFGQAEGQRLNEGSRISTPARREQEEAERQRQSELIAQTRELSQQAMDEYNKRRQSNIGRAGSPTSNIGRAGSPTSNIGRATPYQGLGPNPASNIGVARPGQWTPQRSR